jgi:hypothetical protein
MWTYAWSDVAQGAIVKQILRTSAQRYMCRGCSPRRARTNLYQQDLVEQKPALASRLHFSYDETIECAPRHLPVHCKVARSAMFEFPLERCSTLHLMYMTCERLIILPLALLAHLQHKSCDTEAFWPLPLHPERLLFGYYQHCPRVGFDKYMILLDYSSHHPHAWDSCTFLLKGANVIRSRCYHCTRACSNRLCTRSRATGYLGTATPVLECPIRREENAGRNALLYTYNSNLVFSMVTDWKRPVTNFWTTKLLTVS